ncbi:MAG: helix-turn-helix domain-containing protein [Deltaproteobacteria bacterium]|jgi:excisionase family DNA binding protein|nr:helix-turn-helix domain-containing protein [Deltaproteobacteria bacterium]
MSDFEPTLKDELGMLCGVNEICRYVGKSRSTVFKWIRSGDFPVTKISGEWVIRIEDVHAWVMEKMCR